MCRAIKTLHNFTPPATDEEIRASSLQFVRKLSGFTRPSRANEPAFSRAVDQVTRAARELLDALVTTAAPRDRDVEASKARARSADRFRASGASRAAASRRGSGPRTATAARRPGPLSRPGAMRLRDALHAVRPERRALVVRPSIDLASDGRGDRSRAGLVARWRRRGGRRRRRIGNPYPLVGRRRAVSPELVAPVGCSTPLGRAMTGADTAGAGCGDTTDGDT